MFDQMFGRSMSDWAGINGLMEAHNLKTPADLRARLGELNHRVLVVDAGNEGRILGTLKRPDYPVRGRSLEITVIPRMSAAAYYRAHDPIETFSYKTVRFTFSRRSEDGGWTEQTVLSTSAKLEDLMNLREFRLPGETARQAEERQFRA